jgi:hypothetical protein
MIILAAVAALAVALAFGATGWVVAQGPGPGPRHGSVAGPGMYESCPAGGAMHEDMQEAIAGVLGITREELAAALATGKTMPQIAWEHGVDFATVQAAIQQVHHAYGMAGGAAGIGMMGGRGGMMGGAFGAPAGTCPYHGR